MVEGAQDLIPVHVQLDGQDMTVEYLCVLKHATMVEGAQDLIDVHVHLDGLDMTVGHLFVYKDVQMVEHVQILVSVLVLQGIQALIVKQKLIDVLITMVAVNMIVPKVVQVYMSAAVKWDMYYEEISIGAKMIIHASSTMVAAIKRVLTLLDHTSVTASKVICCQEINTAAKIYLTDIETHNDVVVTGGYHCNVHICNKMKFKIFKTS
ncbi:uncharacterized protein [Dysidea avara]|uniref:uncharacterized protein n=1 Tax=Dysidea avara TaxID=196820 RepID=UPI003330F49D